jgi:hypothetical protein
MSSSLVAGTDYLKRRQLWIWESSFLYSAEDVVIYDKNFYKIVTTHTSAPSVFTDITAGRLVRLVTKKVSTAYYEIGPFTSQAGFSGNIATGARYVNLATDEVIIGYRPTASNSDNGGWSDGGRVTVRFGFALRIARINKL